MTFEEFIENNCKKCIYKKKCDKEIRKDINGNINCDEFTLDFKLWKGRNDGNRNK